MSEAKEQDTDMSDRIGFELTSKSANNGGEDGYPVAYMEDLWDVVIENSPTRNIVGYPGRYDQHTVNEALSKRINKTITTDDVEFGYTDWWVAKETDENPDASYYVEETTENETPVWGLFKKPTTESGESTLVATVEMDELATELTFTATSDGIATIYFAYRTKLISDNDLIFAPGSADFSAKQKHRSSVAGVNVTTDVFSESGISIGAGNTVGLKSYRWITIDFNAKTITFASKPTGWIVNDVLSIVNDHKYPDCSKITAIDIENKIVTVDKLPFDSIAVDTGYDAKTAYVEKKPTVGNIDIGIAAYAQGVGNSAINLLAHAEGFSTTANGQYSHTEGRETTAGYAAHAEGWGTTASGERAHSEGRETTASGLNSHAEGLNTVANASNSHAEGGGTRATSDQAHSEGYHTVATANSSHAEGYNSLVIGNRSHIEGSGNHYFKDSVPANAAEAETLWDTEDSKTTGGDLMHINAGKFAHVEGLNNFNSADCAHVEGQRNKATGTSSHAEGWKTRALKPRAHSEGESTIAGGQDSHAEGKATQTFNEGEHAEGKYNLSSRAPDFETGASYVTGDVVNKDSKYYRCNTDHTAESWIAENWVVISNGSVPNNTMHSIGIGISEATRKNAFEVMQNGDVYIKDIGGYNGTNATSSSSKSVQTVISECMTGASVLNVLYLRDSQNPNNVYEITINNGRLMVNGQVADN